MKIITAKDNGSIKHISKLIKSATYRKKCQQFVIEGVRLCGDALESNVEIVTVVVSQQYFDKNKTFIDKLTEVCESTLLLADRLFSQISDTTTPQGVMFVCNIRLNPIKFKKEGVYIALEHLQDPSNIGTILRTAEALGVSGVILTKNCCDIYSPKVLRGTMGAAFRLPLLICDDMSKMIDELHSLNITTIATVLDKNAISITKLSDTDKKNCAILIGNEGNGLLHETSEKCKIKVTIPMLGRAESLNASVASAISMWEILRGDYR